MAEYRYPINISLVRPRLYFGVERLALLGDVVPAGIGLMLIGQGGYYYAGFLFAVSIAMHVAAMKMAKTDPYMIAIFLRAVRYRRLYAPRATLHGRSVGGGRIEELRYHIIIASAGLIVLIVALIMLGVL